MKQSLEGLLVESPNGIASAPGVPCTPSANLSQVTEGEVAKGSLVSKGCGFEIRLEWVKGLRARDVERFPPELASAILTVCTEQGWLALLKKDN